jgi:hypothetical protein
MQVGKKINQTSGEDMPSYEVDAIYEVLLKRYREYGFLTLKAALDSNISVLVQKGRTRKEAIRELSSSDSPWTYSPSEQPTASKQEEETVKQKAVLGQIANLRGKIDSLTTLFSKGEIAEETYLRGVRKIEDDISRLQREHGIPEVEQKRPSRSISETSRQETEERELLSGKPSIVLTNKRLIAGTRELYLNDISEAYAKQGYLNSKLVIRLKDGTEEEYEITPESFGSSGRVGSFLAVLSGDIAAMEGDLRAHSKATIDRWVNRINSLLT